MQSFTILAADLFYFSKSAFFRMIPDCQVNFVDGCTRMFFNLRTVAAEQDKVGRRKIAALVIAKCSEEHICNFSQWLTDYFSPDMQEEIFSLSVGVNGQIIPDKMLEKALKNIRKR